MSPKELEKLLKELEVLVANRSRKIDKVVAEILHALPNLKKSLSSVYWNKKVKRILRQYNLLEAEFLAYLAPAVASSYDEGVANALSALDKVKVKPKLAKGFQSKTVKALIADAVQNVKIDIDNAKKNTVQIIRRTQQKVITEARVNKALAEGLSKKGNVQSTASYLFKELGGKGAVIRINGRNYKAWPYAKLVVRAKTRAANSYGVVHTAAKGKWDLIKISDHDTTTPICQKYEGKIFSISGRSRRFPKIIEYPPFHPQCLHILSIYIPTTQAEIEDLKGAA